MLKKHLILILGICNYINLVSMQDIIFKTKLADSNCLSEEIKVNLQKDNQIIGFISYTSFPFKIYVVHSFFVFPQYRCQGYGKELLNYTLNTLKCSGARLIFIQPGPFELKNNCFENLPIGTERALKIKKLVNLYKGNGFKLISKIISLCAFPIYKLAGIDEDPQYLMFKRY